MEIRFISADVAALEDQSLFQTLYRSVTAQRQQKVDKIKTEQGKRLSLGAAALLEWILADFGVRKPKYLYGPMGKPYLAGYTDVYFNLSHSGNMVLCTVSHHEVGCDVEQVRDANLSLARRYFAPEEYQTLLSCQEGLKRDRLFYRLWALKESFLKATGLGLQLPLNAFQFHLKSDVIHITQHVDQRHYAFRTFSAEGYEYALCSADQPLDAVVHTKCDFPALAAGLR